MDEGYIKYKCDWNNSPLQIKDKELNYLNKWRNRLFAKNLIGVYSKGIGFGNISCRNEQSNFFITGSATGAKKELQQKDYALVCAWNYTQNSLSCIGNTKASSESLTHAAIYEVSEDIHAVIHVHSKRLWQKYLDILPTTNETIPYGTPEMALAIKALVSSEYKGDAGIIVMAGHEEGVISYGCSLDEAGDLLLRYFTNV